jgi:hypothetical protein
MAADTMTKRMGEPVRTEHGFQTGSIEAICAFSNPTHTAIMVRVGDAVIHIVCSRGGRRATVDVRHGVKTAMAVTQTLWSSEG